MIGEGDDVLDALTLIDAKPYVTYQRNASHWLAIFTRDDAPAGDVAVPEHATVAIRGAGNGAPLLTVTSFTQSSVRWRVDLATGRRTLSDGSPVPFDTSRFDVRQHRTRSADGTRVPLWIVQGRAQARKPNTPALLHGYGKFAVSPGPRFDPRAALWVERVGIFVQATLRRGNEFGEDWHRGGMLADKQHVFDDFPAVAQFLVDSGYTSTARLAIRGGSNDGLLMGINDTRVPPVAGEAVHRSAAGGDVVGTPRDPGA